jgi:Tfp pilus assembly protein PilN
MVSPNELSFLPDDYLERKAQRRTNAICAMLFLVVMVAIGSAFTFSERKMRELEREHELVENQYTEAAKRIQLVQQMQDKQRQMATQAELAASLLEKVPRSFLLAEITNALPVGVSLLDLTMESKLRPTASPSGSTPKSAFEQKRAAAASGTKRDEKPSAQQAKQYDVSLKVSGIAYTDVQVAQFISRLNQSRMLKDVNLVIADEYKERGPDVSGNPSAPLRTFQIEAKLDPKAEVNSLEQKPKTTAAVEIKENN